MPRPVECIIGLLIITYILLMLYNTLQRYQEYNRKPEKHNKQHRLRESEFIDKREPASTPSKSTPRENLLDHDCMKSHTNNEDHANIMRSSKLMHVNESPSIQSDVPKSALYKNEEINFETNYDTVFPNENLEADGIDDMDMTAYGFDNAWKSTTLTNNDDEELKLKSMLKDTLREGVNIVEDNIIDVSQKVKDAYKAPKASDIRRSASQARDFVPEITSRKTEGNIDFAMVHMYKGREPTTVLNTNVEAVQWGATDAYMYQRQLGAQRK